MNWNDHYSISISELLVFIEGKSEHIESGFTTCSTISSANISHTESQWFCFQQQFLTKHLDKLATSYFQDVL